MTCGPGLTAWSNGKEPLQIIHCSGYQLYPDDLPQTQVDPQICPAQRGVRRLAMEPMVEPHGFGTRLHERRQIESLGEPQQIAGRAGAVPSMTFHVPFISEPMAMANEWI